MRKGIDMTTTFISTFNILCLIIVEVIALAYIGRDKANSKMLRGLAFMIEIVWTIIGIAFAIEQWF